MSNLRHLTLEQLKQEKQYCEKYILSLTKKRDYYSGCVGRQLERLRWIEYYMEKQKTRPLVNITDSGVERC